MHCFNAGTKLFPAIQKGLTLPVVNLLNVQHQSKLSQSFLHTAMPVSTPHDGRVAYCSVAILWIGSLILWLCECVQVSLGEMLNPQVASCCVVWLVTCGTIRWYLLQPVKKWVHISEVSARNKPRPLLWQTALWHAEKGKVKCKTQYDGI